MNTGLILNEPSSEYHGNGAVSSSKLADIRIAGELCPQNYFVRHVSKTAPRKAGAHFDIGIAAHLAILEGPDAYDKQCILEPATYISTPEPTKKNPNPTPEEKPWNNNANVCKAWYSGCAGRTVLSRSEADLIAAMSAAVAGSDEARALTARGDAEVTFRKVIAGMTLQCRVDKWHPSGVLNIDGPVIVDLKTCNTIEQFEREFYFLRYNVRAEFYRLVVSEVLAQMAGVPVDQIEAPSFVFVAVEKSTPHRVKVYQPDAESLEAGRREVHADLLTLRNCLASGTWPTGTNGIHPIGLKTWQLAKSEESSNAVLAA